MYYLSVSINVNYTLLYAQITTTSYVHVHTYIQDFTSGWLTYAQIGSLPMALGIFGDENRKFKCDHIAQKNRMALAIGAEKVNHVSIWCFIMVAKLLNERLLYYKTGNNLLIVYTLKKFHILLNIQIFHHYQIII